MSPDLNLITAGGDMSMSKSFGISGVASITPYVGYQMLFIVGSSRLLNAYPQDPRSPQFDQDRPAGEGSTTFSPEFVFEQYDTQINRVFFGTRINVWVLNFGLGSTTREPCARAPTLAFPDRFRSFPRPTLKDPMIVECPECSTQFNLPADRVTTRGSKVRCSKCSKTCCISQP